MTVQYRVEMDEQWGPVIESDYVSRADRMSEGQSRRTNASRKTHAGWTPPPERRDPVEVLEETNQGRVPELIPIRYGRMLAGPFPFLRGSAAVMAEDLASTPTSGIRVQACGDCHLLNFGLFASPERNLFFGINDFDETLNAPFEWDVKRLAVSFMVAGQANGYSGKAGAGVVETMVRSYREYMAHLATMRALDVWYTRLDADLILETAPSKKARRYRETMIAKARKRVAEYVFPKLTAEVNGRRRFVDQPPLITHQDWSRERYENLLRALRPVSRVPASRPEGDPRPLPHGRHRVQGRRDRLGRNPGLRDPAPGRGRGSPDPAGQGGAPLRARAVRRRGAVRAAGPARGRGAAADPGRERYLPRLVHNDATASTTTSASSGT